MKTKIMLTICFLGPATYLLATPAMMPLMTYIELGLYLSMALVLVVTIAASISVVKLFDYWVKQDTDTRKATVSQTAADQQGSSTPLWQRLYARATAMIPVSREKEILLDHDYDGIKELDNDLPPWWLAMFYITIVVGVVYFVYDQMTDLSLSSEEAYYAEVAKAEEQIAAFRATQANFVDETNVVALTDDQSLANGKQIFTINCAVCHLENGAGLVGPNLTDQYWLHGGSINDIFTTIKYGVPEKGMIAWSAQLRPAAMQEVASYILTLQGTNPPNGKAPEGDLYQPGEEAGDTEISPESTEGGETTEPES